jgi:hypothetical protein
LSAEIRAVFCAAARRGVADTDRMARVATAATATAEFLPRTQPQPFDALGVLVAIDADKQLQVTVTTLGADGCTFRSPVPFRPGETYTLRIGTGPLYLASTLRIIASRDRSDGLLDVAASFV